MNRASSRSHAICQLKILKERAGNPTGPRPSSFPGSKTPEFNWCNIQDGDDDGLNDSHSSIFDEELDDEELTAKLTDLEDGVTSVRGKIYICDLAGSERIKKTKASGERLQEAQHINSSLLELGNVINALAQGKNRSHVPFRNSTLTRLLQEGLSGNCKTRLVICVAPTMRDTHESKCSLNFGSRAMKVQVMAHVNYEVDYKKLAEVLAAKLEALEAEVHVTKTSHEGLIASLKAELASRRSPTDGYHHDSDKPTKPHVHSLLILELMTLQLFYSLQGKSRVVGETGHGNGVPAQVNFCTDGDSEMMLKSMEGLLELLDDHLRGRRRDHSFARNASTASSTGSAILSPDLENASMNLSSASVCTSGVGSAAPSFLPEDLDYPSPLEPVHAFLEQASLKENINGLPMQTNLITEKVDAMPSANRLRRVMSWLSKLKLNINSNAMKHLKKVISSAQQQDDTIDVNLFKNLEDITSAVSSQVDIQSRLGQVPDTDLLEDSLYYLLMDKALISCQYLLTSHSSIDAYDKKQDHLDINNNELKRVLEDLSSERSQKEKLRTELSLAHSSQQKSEERMREVESELRELRELKSQLEEKLVLSDEKCEDLEDQIEAVKLEHEDLEKQIEDVDKKRATLEASLKNSENNNGRKERLIIDLKNEKVALEGLVSTLKDELSILEKEKLRDTEERRQLEEELEDVRDRNIILETEWSCCKEENGLLETELTALEEDKVILEDEILKYKDDVKMLEEALSVLEAQAADYKQEITCLKKKEDRLADDMRGEKEKLTKELNSLRQEISGLRVERRKFQRDISVSRADKSNTERAYTALKTQKDTLQNDVSGLRADEKRLQREMSTLKSEKSKLERDVQSLRAENAHLKQELVHADRIKTDMRLLQKNEEKIASVFNIEKDKLMEELASFKDKFTKLESDFGKVTQEKEKLAKQLRRYSNDNSSGRQSSSSRSRNNTPGTTKSVTPEKPNKRATPDKSVKRRSLAVTRSEQQGTVGQQRNSCPEVSAVETRVHDLQRRLAFFMTEKEDIQKELTTTRERNEKLVAELRTLEKDTSNIQLLLNSLNKDKNELTSNLEEVSESRKILEQERDQLKEAVRTAREITTRLQTQLDDATEKNRTLEHDHATIRDCLKKLQAQTVTLTTENKHVTKELNDSEEKLKTSNMRIEELGENLLMLQKKVSETQTSEKSLEKKVQVLSNENMSLTEQLSMCKSDEQKLVEHLSGLSERFSSLEGTLEQVLIERSAYMQENVKSNELAKQVRNLKERNSFLEQSSDELKIQLETLIIDSEVLRQEREQIETILSNGNQYDKLLTDSVRSLKDQVTIMTSEKQELESSLADMENKLNSLRNKSDNMEKSQIEQDTKSVLKAENEARYYVEHIEQLEHQIGQLVQDRKQLDAEVEFLKRQNCELRSEIAIILEENDKLEHELEELEEDYEKQEGQLDSATEETKTLLRQLCSAESQNLTLTSLAHDCETYKMEVTSLRNKNEKSEGEVNSLKNKVTQMETMSQKYKDLMTQEYTDVRVNAEKDDIHTIHDRLLMAQIEISRLRSELKNVEEQRQLLISDLDAADQERELFKTELQNLARAISPLKREVNNITLKREVDEAEKRRINEEDNLLENVETNNALQEEIEWVKSDLHASKKEKAVAMNEQDELKRRISVLKKERMEMREKLHQLIQDLEVRHQTRLSNRSSSHGELEDAIRMIGSLISQQRNISDENLSYEEQNITVERANTKLDIQVETSSDALKQTQDDLCLVTMEQMKLKDRVRTIGRCVSEMQGSTLEKEAATGDGLVRLQDEVRKLKDDIQKFELSQEDLLSEVRTLNESLNEAENQLLNVGHFKNVIESNLIEYRQRNSTLESHLRAIYDDLVTMESNQENPDGCNLTIQSSKLLLETLDLQNHFNSLEKDLNTAEDKIEKNAEQTQDLNERCEQLQHEKEITSESSGLLAMTLEEQKKTIDRLTSEKETLAYEKKRLITKLSLYKDDKNRILDDFQKMNKSLSAYARYNRELEEKLQSFQVDLGELEKRACSVDQVKEKHFLEKMASKVQSATAESSNSLLCKKCRELVQHRFKGCDKNGKLAMGSELLDCIEDSLTLETAILSFMEQKNGLANELVTMESDRKGLEALLGNCNEGGVFTWERGSQSSVDSECVKRLWSSGQLSSRSKSMMSDRSGESFYDNEDVRSETSGRSHTALGIYTEEAANAANSTACDILVSPPATRAATASPTGRKNILLSPSALPNKRRCSSDSSPPMQGSKRSLTDFPDHNEQLPPRLELSDEFERLESLDEEPTLLSPSSEDKQKSNHLAGFLKKFRSSKRLGKRSNSSSGKGEKSATSPSHSETSTSPSKSATSL